jgi:uncharacterized glyoxalase superfamily protein PhnB
METPTFVPAVTYRDPKAATAWLAHAFGFELTMAIEDPDGDPARGHWEMSSAGSGRIMVGGAWDERTASPLDTEGRVTQVVHVAIAGDIDAHCAAARQAGARIIMEPADQFYGDRTYRALDAEGHIWTFSQAVRAVTRAEAEQAIGAPIFATEWA